MENFYTKYNRHMPDFKMLTNLPNVQLNREEAILSLIVVLGSSISLVGLIFAFITYSLFSDLRSMSGTLIMNLLATLFMTQLMYVIGVGGTQDPELCVSLAFALQYFHLAEFCWLLSLTYNMYHTFRTNLNLIVVSPHYKIVPSFVKYSLFGWGTPVLFLLFGFWLHREFNAPYSHETFRFDYLNCWFLNEKIYIYSYVLPVTILLVLIAHRMYKTWIIIRYSVALQVDYKVKEKMRQARLLQYYLYVKITLLLTLTYICGAIARLTHYNIAWISFNVEHSLQGLLVAIAVTCNCQILKIYAKSIRRRRRKRENLIEICKFKKRTRDISRSTSLDTLSWQPELLSV
ncbi:adhesion G protein-coupled receptor L4-like [Planococcus citri]|uniref:adhesion G protein-coupled receptor L4-like n=1 Tax=Planococcus citri TaxID=170843 RepID=UPI0031FA0E82